jgi:hypothetical protein
MTALAIKNIDISGSVFLNGIASEVFVDRLTEKLGGFVARAMSSSCGGGFAHYICSSTLDITCSAGWFEPLALTRKIQAASGLRCSYSNAMQCATWGFLVRQHLVNKPDVRNILISVVDANPLGIRFWVTNAAWGKTGHRVTLVHLQSPEQDGDSAPNYPADAITVSKCNPNAALYDYALEIQRAMARHPDHTLAIPYFEEKMRKGLKRSMDGYAYLPDRYEEFGHLCGSDPWMSIARDVASASAGSKRYLASSFASEGYCCFLSVTTDAHSKICIEGHA